MLFDARWASKTRDMLAGIELELAGIELETCLHSRHVSSGHGVMLDLQQVLGSYRMALGFYVRHMVRVYATAGHLRDISATGKISHPRRSVTGHTRSHLLIGGLCIPRAVQAERAPSPAPMRLAGQAPGLLHKTVRMYAIPSNPDA